MRALPQIKTSGKQVVQESGWVVAKEQQMKSLKQIRDEVIQFRLKKETLPRQTSFVPERQIMIIPEESKPRLVSGGEDLGTFSILAASALGSKSPEAKRKPA